MFIGIKKARPKEWDKKTPIEALRWTPRHHLGLGTWGRPTTARRFEHHTENPLTGEKQTKHGKLGQSSDWEDWNVLEERDEGRKLIEDAIKYYEDMGRPVTSEHQEKLLSELPQVMPGHEEGWDVEGTWVSPADMRTFTNPDVTINRQVPSSLIGVTKKPNWYRSDIHANKQTPEGFHYGGYENPSESMFDIPLPEGVSHPRDLYEDIQDGEPLTMEWLKELQENPNIPLGEHHEQLSWDDWKKTPPLTTEQLVEQQLLWPRKLVGEPMDEAWSSLLKAKKHGWMGVSSHGNFSPITRNTDVHIKRPPKITRHENVLGYLSNLQSKQKIDADIMRNALKRYGYTNNLPPEQLKRIASLLPLAQTQHDKNKGERKYVPQKYESIPGGSVSYSTGTPEFRSIPPKTARALPPALRNVNLGQLIEHSDFMDDLHNMSRHDDAVQRIKDWEEKQNQPLPSQQPGIREKLPEHIADASKQLFCQNCGSITCPGCSSPTPIATGEPMDIAFQLLKEREMSPEAKRHKLEYDTKYESSPVRVKYREELNRERRRRGIYGSGDHKDVSHTEGGKLTLEGEHANRARHFKNRGTLRKGKY